MWKVDRILEVRRTVVARATRQRRRSQHKFEARVRWFGGPTQGPGVGLPWPDAWKPVAQKWMNARCHQEALALKRARYGSVAPAATWRRGSKRSQRLYEMNEEMLPIAPPRRRRQGRELEEGTEEYGSGAMGFLRECEARAAARGAARRGLMSALG